MNKNDIKEELEKDSNFQFMLDLSASFSALYAQLQKKNLITFKDVKEINKNTELFKEHIIKLSIDKIMEEYRSQGGKE